MRNDAICYNEFGVPEKILKLENRDFKPYRQGVLRVKMLFSPVNASDLIPVTGAYHHRITLPMVAGYEGVGYVTAAPDSHRYLTGQRVLPLRGEGTWQTLVDCPAEYAIPVPEEISNELAARAYINPVAALMMLRLHPPADRHILLTAAASDCALLLGQWALRLGAKKVTGIHRSPLHAKRLSECGIIPVSQHDSAAVQKAIAASDLVFDAVGGELAEIILQQLVSSATFVCYGLLSGKTFRQRDRFPTVHWFHIRNQLNNVDVTQWHAMFRDIWKLMKSSYYSEVVKFPFDHWESAINYYRHSGRQAKPLLQWGHIPNI
ncbi:zinc-dependent alcohol dehydrogenase family protein [Erwinia mallotivora]|uniref:Alcohol dehydrogenase n=1 Tax=Erwinia mallotivora TaxID=69222 RepID=A0A014LZ49_9GAMM|nr:zinc-dependent alcohol dehydrogenase family protein [Erwinia mallotivora]EXU74846.1 alcohol dehydrogenase [Erwinia mallotivora]